MSNVAPLLQALKPMLRAMYVTLPEDKRPCENDLDEYFAEKGNLTLEQLMGELSQDIPEDVWSKMVILGTGISTGATPDPARAFAEVGQQLLSMVNDEESEMWESEESKQTMLEEATAHVTNAYENTIEQINQVSATLPVQTLGEQLRWSVKLKPVADRFSLPIHILYKRLHELAALSVTDDFLSKSSTDQIQVGIDYLKVPISEEEQSGPRTTLPPTDRCIRELLFYFNNFRKQMQSNVNVPCVLAL